MGADKEWRPRLSIDLTEEQYKRMQKNFPWGTRQPLFSVLVDEVNSMVEKYGVVALGALLKGELAIVPKASIQEKENFDDS